MSDRTWHDDEEDWSETGDDDDFSAAADLDADSIPCPECGAAIYADLDHCPQCGYWLTDADRRARNPGLFQSRGVRIVAAVLLIIFVLGLLAGTLGM